MFQPVSKVAIIGLDCAEPSLVFDRWAEDLPNLTALRQAGLHGPLRSVDPPITVPAWSCMMTSQDPGRLGIYGFRNRKDYSYDGLSFATSRMLTVPRLWDRLGQQYGERSIAISVPQSYPPTPMLGDLVGCFLTPDTAKSNYTHPPELKAEIERTVGQYMVDVPNFRGEDWDRILKDIYAMTDQRFRLAKHLVSTRDWQFFIMVEIGVDRIHHGFWLFHDETHPRHPAGNQWKDAIHDYYVTVDRHIGDLLEAFDEDTAVMVVSDHGIQKMDGGICVNEWLWREGYLAFEKEPEGLTPIAKMKIDWSRTRAWGEGGYYCRLCLNVQGREPEGIVDPADYEGLRSELIQKLEALTDPDGNNIGTRAMRPGDLYEVANGIPPDLLVYFGDLSWRSVGSVGHGSIWTFENDTGPDFANHAQDGILILKAPGVPPGRRLEEMKLLDVAPTVMELLGHPLPAEYTGESILPRLAATPVV